MCVCERERERQRLNYLLNIVIGPNFYDTFVMIQRGGMFTHLGIPKVCSHTRDVEFHSQHTPSNTTFDRQIVSLGMDWSFGRPW